MKERPILFSAPMVRAILDGSKTQTRRFLNGADQWHPDTVRVGIVGVGEDGIAAMPFDFYGRMLGGAIKCKYGKPGDRLWVRETWRSVATVCLNNGRPSSRIEYAAGDKVLPFGKPPAVWTTPSPDGPKWRPSIHMPRAASRINLEITGVRVERLQDISEADSIAEGIERSGECNWCDYLDYGYNDFTNAKHSYRSLWEQINGAGSWEANPWVWVVEFKRV